MGDHSSFANTDGGIILFGVEEHLKENEFDKRFSFVSIINPDQRLKDFWNTVNSEKVSSNILVDADVGTCAVNGCTLCGSTFHKQIINSGRYI